MLKTFAAQIEYDGSQFNGWQIQKNAPSAQAALERALSRVADEPVRVHCAGRTDTGVHSVGQIIHFKTEKQRTLYSWLRGVNTNLSPGIAMPWIQPVSDDFHARFSAQSRQYRYIFYLRKVKPGILNSYVSWDHRDLSLSLMREAAVALLGEHDFNAFRSVHCQAKTSTRTIYLLDIQQQGKYLYFDIKGNAFLHHMVRNIAGVLAAIGAGERPLDWVSEVLASRDRRKGGITALPNGLYLTKVSYPVKFEILNESSLPCFW